MRIWYLLIMVLFFSSCKENEKSFIINVHDYNGFLNTSHTPTLDIANSEKEFWSKRLRTDSSGIGDLVPLANAYTSLFEITGDINHLKSAENLYRKAATLTHSKDDYIRLLASNLISQQVYKEAESILEESYQGVSNKRATEYLLFDVYFNSEKYDKAFNILDKLKNRSDIDYLFRLAKWEEYKGNQIDAIKNIKKAKEIAESRKNKKLQIKSYLFLADLFMKSGKFKESYGYILKTLQLQTDNVLAKKQLARILYSYEKNTIEANRILDSIMIVNKSPELNKLKVDMPAF